jgi:hypothetical protein
MFVINAVFVLVLGYLFGKVGIYIIDHFGGWVDLVVGLPKRGERLWEKILTKF